jgi:hypothetical protein
MKALDEEDQINGHAEEQDAEYSSNEDGVAPVVFFGPGGASPGSFILEL